MTSYTNATLTISASTYTVSFTRTPTATASASVAVFISGSDQLVAQYSGPISWATDPGDYVVSVNQANAITIFVSPVEGTLYYAVVASVPDGGSTSPSIVYTQPYTGLSIGTILPTGYPCTVTRTASATGTATLYIRCGSAFVATFKTAQPWTVPGTYTVLVTADNSTGFVPPTVGSQYIAQFSSPTDDGWYQSSTQSAPYTLPYTGLTLSAINSSGYTVKFTQNASATGGPTLSVTSGGNVVAQYVGNSTVGATNIVLTSSNSSGWVAPIRGTTYTVTLTDVADNVTLTANHKY